MPFPSPNDQPDLHERARTTRARAARRTTATLAVVAVLLLVAACSGGGASSSSSAASSSTSSSTGSPSASASSPERAKPVALPPAPACYDLGYDGAVAPTTSAPRVPCSKAHTAVTVVSGHLRLTQDGHLLSVDSQAVQDQVARTCPAAVDKALGGTTEERRLSMLKAVWFTPTLEQAAEGADWYRCDVIAVSGDDRLAPLTGAVKGVVGQPAGDRYEMCGTAEPGTQGFRRVVCSAPHSWKAIGIVPISGQDYPGAAAARSQGEGTCQAQARSAAADPLSYTWSYEYPTAQQWREGQRYGYCWLKA